MFVKVRLLNGFRKELTYKVPENLYSKNLLNKIVRVPIRNKHLSAIVTQEFENLNQKENFEIRELIGFEIFPKDNFYEIFTESLSQYYQINKLFFLKRIKGFLNEKSELNTDTIPENNIKQEKTKIKNPEKIETYTETCNKKEVKLTLEQETVVNYLERKILNLEYAPTLLHGVTGSGKTEIYKKLIIKSIETGKSVLLLLPEVTLAIQFEKIMRDQLPENISIHSFHSGTSIKNKKTTWELLLKNAPVLIIGVHIPVILPIPNLGLIIVDEEHESGYQEKKHPKINSKDAAIMRANLNKIPILLGSATPSISSLHNVKTKNWKFFQLKNRFSGNFPEIKTVFLSDKKLRRNFWISQELEDAIRDRLAKKEQIIIFLNRRGYSFFVQCKDCAHIFSCPNCSVSLTLHSNKTNKLENKTIQANNSESKNEILTCHYCNYAIEYPTKCPKCSKTEFLKKGIGTQQVVTILEKLFPFASIARADMDTSTKKKLWQETMQNFESGKINILVGTQTISKGFHFPRVTLVGILWADLNLHFPIYNSSETTLQQLIQVAGRAGRNSQESLVIVQAMGQNKIFDFLNEIDYLNFYTHEADKRDLLGYPPYKRLIEIELKNTNEIILDKEANSIAIKLINLCKSKNFMSDILGPSEPPVAKIKNIYTRKIYVKCNNITSFGNIFQSIDKDHYSSSIFFTPNPLN